MAGARRCRRSSLAAARLKSRRPRPSPPPPRAAAPSPSRSAGLAAFALSLALAPSAAAQPAAAAAPAPARPAAAPRRPIEVRVALSAAAAENLVEPRLRRLLDIELAETATVAPVAVGPLDAPTAYVWIERPTPARLEIQVRLDTRPMVRRSIAISGLTSDVAARLVAIAASELIRAEIHRLQAPRRPPPPRRPSPEELELAARDRDALGLAVGPHAALLPAPGALLVGPGLAVGLRRLRVTESLFARWLGAPLDDGSLRWLEAGVAVDYRLWASPDWRVSLGAAASLASLRLAGAAAVDGVPGEEDTWSARGGAALGVEARVGGPLWLGLTLEPGAVLRPAPYEPVTGAARAVEGAWLGVGLSLSVETIAGPR